MFWLQELKQNKTKQKANKHKEVLTAVRKKLVITFRKIAIWSIDEFSPETMKNEREGMSNSELIVQKTKTKTSSSHKRNLKQNKIKQKVL